MLGLFALFALTFFLAVVYAAVILIQIGGVLAVMAGMLLVCFYFISGALSLVGFASCVASMKKKKGD